MESLKTSTDVFLRTELVSRITELAERYAPDNKWFIETMNSVFDLGGSLVRPEIAHNLMRLIAEGTDEDDEADNELRQYAVKEYFAVLNKSETPELFLQLASWVIGEYSYVEESIPDDDILARLCDLADRTFEDPGTRGFIITAMMKVVANSPDSMNDDVAELITKHSNSKNVDLQQRCYEFLTLVANPDLMEVALPVDASTEEIDIDVDLTFLDDFVEDAIEKGAKEYDHDYDEKTPRERAGVHLPGDGSKEGLKWQQYEKPVEKTILEDNEVQPRRQEFTPVMDDGQLRVNNRAPKWGEGGYEDTSKLAVAEPVVAAPAPWTGDEPKEAPAKAGRDDRPRSKSGAADHVDDAKAQMANALFGGTPEPAATESAKEPKKKKKTKKKEAAAEVQPEVTPEAVPETKKPAKKTKKKRAEAEAPPKAAPPPAPSAEEDLLGDFFGMEVSSGTTSAPAKPAAGPPTDDLMDLLGDGPVSALPVQPAAPMQPVGSGGLLKPVSGAMAAGASQAGMPASLQAQLSGSLTQWSPTRVAGDAVLEIQTAKVHRSQELAVVVVVQNNSASPLNGVEVVLDPPRNLQVSYIGEPQPAIQGNRLTISNVSARSKAYVVVKLGVLDIAPSMALRGQIGYKGDRGVTSLSFQTIIEVSDLLRPVALSTEEFGQKWPTFGDGKRIKVQQSSVTTTADYARRVKEVLCINPVQVIGTEVISAGELMGTGKLVLVHAALDLTKGALNITVNSPHSLLSDLVCRNCQSTFQ